MSKLVLLRSTALAAILATALTACGDRAADTSADKKSTATSAAAAPIAGSASTPSTFHVTDAQRERLQIVTVAVTKFRPVIEATGTVAFNGDRSTQVISPISGPVVRLVAQLGAQVTAGQTLATVSSPDFATAVAGYRKAEEMARNTKRIRDLDEKLFANDALARTNLDQARTDEASAIADRDAAAQQLRSIGIEESVINAIHDGKQTATVEGAIRAPIPGTVVEKLINPGQLLAAGTTIAFNIADLSSMWVLASIYGSDLASIHVGETVEIVTDVSLTPVRGHVDFVASIVDPGTRATTVRILAGNPNQLLKRDMFVRVRILSARERSGIMVPATSVLRDDDNLPFVFIANADKSFSRRRITLGTAVDGRYEIVDGVNAGEQVLANGALFVQFAEHQ